MTIENEKFETLELNEEELAKANGGYGNALNMRGRGVTPGLRYQDSISKRYFYLVKTGDTMSGIAAMFGMNLQYLISLNPHIPNPNKIWDYDVVWIS